VIDIFHLGRDIAFLFTPGRTTTPRSTCLLFGGLILVSCLEFAFCTIVILLGTLFYGTHYIIAASNNSGASASLYNKLDISSLLSFFLPYHSPHLPSLFIKKTSNQPLQTILYKSSKLYNFTMASTNPGNFANRPTEEVREIASKGGLASQGSGATSSSTTSDNPGNFANRPTEEVREIASKGGQARAAQLQDDSSSTGNTNPGNFANRPTEEVREIASKGGQARAAQFEDNSSSTTNTNPGNFANRPTEEVREIASKGGQARAAQLSDDSSSTGNTNPGNFANRPTEEVREAGAKGGST